MTSLIEKCNQVKRKMQPKDRLKIVRQELGNISQARMSEISEIPVYKIKDIESGKTKISVEIASLLEKNFNFSFRWLLTGEGEMFSDVRNKNENATEIPKISESHPKIIKIVNLLKTMGNTDIDDVEKMLEERKKIREIEYKLSKMEEILKQKNA